MEKYPDLCSLQGAHLKTAVKINAECHQVARSNLEIKKDIQKQIDQKMKNKEDAFGKFLNRTLPSGDSVKQAIDLETAIEDVIEVEHLNEIITDLEIVQKVELKCGRIDGVSGEVMVDIVQQAVQNSDAMVTLDTRIKDVVTQLQENELTSDFLGLKGATAAAVFAIVLGALLLGAYKLSSKGKRSGGGGFFSRLFPSSTLPTQATTT